MKSVLAKVILGLVPVLIASCGEERTRLFVEDGSLVQSVGRTREILLAAVGQDEARSGACVRRVHEVVSSRDGTRAVVRLTVGRGEVALPVCLGPGSRVSSGDGIGIPWNTGVVVSPDAGTFLLVSTKDLYLPRRSSFLLNRGVMLVSFERRSRHPEIEAALTSEAPGPWYGAPGQRYVPSDEFEVERIEWTPRGCRLDVLESDGSRRTVALNPV